MTKGKLQFGRLLGVAVICVHSLAPPVMAASEQVSASEAFEVTVVNDCAKAVDARFVVVSPGQKEPSKAEARRVPFVRLPARSKTSRKMIPGERLIVLERQGRLSAGFDTKEKGAGSVIRIGADCSSISEEAAKRH